MGKTVVFGFRSDFQILPERWQALKQEFADQYRLIARDDCSAETLAEAEIFIGWPSMETLRAMPHLQWLQLPSAGADVYSDQCTAMSPQVTVTNASGVYNSAGAEHILASLLALARRLDRHVAQQMRHEWRAIEPACQLDGATATIVGLGNIGCATAERLAAFGVKVLGIKRSSVIELPSGVTKIYTLDDITSAVSASDFVINILPLTPETVHLFDRLLFAAFKPNSIFINAGRGQSVVETDLIDALAEGLLAGAALDVTEQEPLPADSPLWDMPNVLMTSHSLGLSRSKLDKQVALFRDNLTRYVHGTPLKNRVDRALGY
ncbi:MAG: D-2-hydroxyacid dehydrogenase [Sporolactobacillus sp.]